MFICLYTSESLHICLRNTYESVDTCSSCVCLPVRLSLMCLCFRYQTGGCENAVTRARIYEFKNNSFETYRLPDGE